MSEREDGHGGRYEPGKAIATQRGEGHAHTGKCDECQATVTVRHPTKVKRGALRGLRCMVCRACMALREAVPA